MDINEIRNRILNEAEVKDYDDTLMDISTYCEEIKLAVDRLVHGIEYTKRLPNDFVFDENKSVKWNREMVIKTNSETEERKELKRDFEFVGKDIIREWDEDYERMSKGTTFTEEELENLFRILKSKFES